MCKAPCSDRSFHCNASARSADRCTLCCLLPGPAPVQLGPAQTASSGCVVQDSNFPKLSCTSGDPRLGRIISWPILECLVSACSPSRVFSSYFLFWKLLEGEVWQSRCVEKYTLFSHTSIQQEGICVVSRCSNWTSKLIELTCQASLSQLSTDQGVNNWSGLDKTENQRC